MTPESVAAQLDGREYPFRLETSFTDAVKAAGLVIVSGASDDLIEFEGAIYDEAGVYDGGTVHISPDGLAQEWEQIDHDDKEAMRKFFASEGKGKAIEAIWDKDGISWQYKTDIPHATFKVMEDGDVYCIGIVFRLEDCK